MKNINRKDKYIQKDIKNKNKKVKKQKNQSILNNDGETKNQDIRKKVGTFPGAPGSVISKLEHLASKYNVKIIKVNPAYTSQTCFRCKKLHKELKGQKIFICPACGYVRDRDDNAADNILFAAMYPDDPRINMEEEDRIAKPEFQPELSEEIAK